MPKNVQTTTQLHSCHMLVKYCSKFSKPGFNITWTMNFHMFKPDLEMAEEPEIKLPISSWSLEKQESSRHLSTSALLTMPKPLTVWIITNCGKFFKRWEYQTTWPASQEFCMQVKKQQNWTWNNRLVPNKKRSTSRLYIVTYAEYILRNAGLEETQAGIKIAGRNINNLRYADDTTLMSKSEEELKTLLMRVKEESGKSWLNTQHSKN